MDFLNILRASIKKTIKKLSCCKLIFVFGYLLFVNSLVAEETVPEYPEKLEGSAEVGIINTTGSVGTQHLYLRTYAVKEQKDWRWYGNLSGSRTLVSDEIVSERYESFAQGDYKLLETDYLFLTLGYESDIYNGIRHRLTETLGYGQKFFDNESWENRLELGLGFRHTVFERTRGLTHVPIINVKGIINYKFAEKTKIEQILSVKVGEDSTDWGSITSLEQAIVDNFALKISHTINYTENPPPDIEKVYTVTYMVLIYNF